MNPQVFMLYGAHDTKMYGAANLRNCFKQFNAIIRENKLSCERVISIVENSVINLDYLKTRPEDSPEKYAEEKTEIEDQALEAIRKMKDPWQKKLIRKFNLFRGVVSTTPFEEETSLSDWKGPLLLFLKRKGVIIVFEDNNPEIIRKDLEYRKMDLVEQALRIHEGAHEVDNLRDKFLVEQALRINKEHPDHSFIIIRGGLHTLASKLFKQAGFIVKDYRY
jgi:hypothetical protein